MKTTKAQRDRLRELLSKTSQGEWKVGLCIDGKYADRKTLVKTVEDNKEVVGIRQVGRPQRREVEENIEFIVEAHNLLSDLLDDLEELEEKAGQ